MRDWAELWITVLMATHCFTDLPWHDSQTSVENLSYMYLPRVKRCSNGHEFRKSLLYMLMLAAQTSLSEVKKLRKLRKAWRYRTPLSYVETLIEQSQPISTNKVAAYLGLLLFHHCSLLTLLGVSYRVDEYVYAMLSPRPNIGLSFGDKLGQKERTVIFYE